MNRPRSSSYPFEQLRPEIDDPEPSRSALLRLLDPESNVSIDDPELRSGLASMVELMERLESMAEQALVRAREQEEAAERASSAGDESAWQLETGATGEFVISGRLVSFTPSDGESTGSFTIFGGPEAYDEEPAVGHDVGAPEDMEASTDPIVFPFDINQFQPAAVEEPSIEDNLERWWIHFNGEVSLERLCRVRKDLEQSPFTIDARFNEITDGLIVMRLVTESHLSPKQVDWIVSQSMEAAGLDRDAAIVSHS
jgi:hypothetical protein